MRQQKADEQVPDCLVPVERIELPTFGLQNRCSTAELNRLTKRFQSSRDGWAFRLLDSPIGIDGEAPSNNRLGWPGLGDLAAILELKLQIFDQLGQPLAGEGVAGFQGEPAGLRQSSVELFTVLTGHFSAPARLDGGTCKMFTDNFTRR
jgi:hypothetical protein